MVPEEHSVSVTHIQQSDEARRWLEDSASKQNAWECEKLILASKGREKNCTSLWAAVTIDAVDCILHTPSNAVAGSAKR